MDDAMIERREFLKTTTGLLTGLVIAGSPLALSGAEFAPAPEAERVATLKKVEASEFFQPARLKTLQVLYANK